MKNFAGKIVVITGAGSGIGRALAIEFARQGAHLALNGRSRENVEETKKMALENGAESVLCSIFDVSDKAAMYAFADEVKNTLGPAHVMINNAGVDGGNRPVVAMPDEQFEKLMTINYYSVVYGSKAFISHFIERNEGALLNISSVFGLVSPPGGADYAASKFAVRGFTESLMAEFQDTPISIHGVYPGGINTNISRDEHNAEFDAKYLTTPPEKIAKHIIKCIVKNKPKIVYGNQSLRIWLSSIFVPTKLFSWIIWNEVKEAVDLNDYYYLKKQASKKAGS